MHIERSEAAAVEVLQIGIGAGQREIDLKFHPLMGREERFIPLVRPLVGETGRQFMLIEVTGSLDAPQVKRTVFPQLDEQLEQLFPVDLMESIPLARRRLAARLRTFETNAYRKGSESTFAQCASADNLRVACQP